MLIYGSTAEDAELVIIYGNCQVPYLAALLACADLGRRGYLCVLNHGLPDTEMEMPSPQHLRRCRLYLEQLDTRAVVPARDQLREALPPRRPRLVFPSYIMGCLWPFTFIDPRNKPEPGFAWGRYPTGNMLALSIAKQGLTGRAAVDAYMELSAARMPDLARSLENEFSQSEERDRLSDVQIADYVRANFRDRHLFWTLGHVEIDAMAELAGRIYMQALPYLGGDLAVGLNALLGNLHTLPAMGAIQEPIHPIVAETYGLTYCPPDKKYRWYNQMWTFEEYIERYIAYDTSW